MDMKTSISVYGAPEFQLARLAVAEHGPVSTAFQRGGTPAIPTACLFDEQAAADAVFSVLVALLAAPTSFTTWATWRQA